jgi:predicted amidohydrolase YtcJ
VGARADLCLLDRPLAAVYSEPLSRRVAATIVGGQVVYEA